MTTELVELANRAQGGEAFTHDVHCPQMNRPCTCKRTPTPATGSGGEGRVFYVLESFTDGVGGQYWAGNTWFNFTTDVDKAIQYCRKRDAEQVTFEKWRLGSDIRVIEHMMIGDHPATGSGGEQS